MSIEKLWLAVGADTDGLKKELAQATKSLKDFGKGVEEMGQTLSKSLTAPLVGVGAALTGLAVGAGQYSDRILDLTATTGMSASAIQEWEAVTRAAGVSTDAITKSTEFLIKQMPMLERGSGEAAKAFEQLGIGFDDFRQLSPDQMVETLVGKLAQMDDPVQRNAIAANLLGRSWKELAPVLSLGAERIDEIRQRASKSILPDELLIQANKFREEFDLLTGEMKILALVIGAQLAPIFTETLIPAFVEHAIPAILAMADGIKFLIDAFTALPNSIQLLIVGMAAVLAAIGPALVVVGKLIGLFASVKIAVATLTAAVAVVALPFVKIAAAIGAVVAVGWLLVKNWDELVSWGKQLTDVLLTGLGAAIHWFGETVRSVFAAVISAGQALGKGFMGAVEGVLQGVTNVTETVKAFISGLVAMVSKGFSAIGRAMIAPFQAAGKKIAEIAGRARNAMQKINPFHRESPSLVDNVRAGVGEIANEYGKLANIELARPESADMGVGAVPPAGTGGGQLHIALLDDIMLRKLNRALRGVDVDERLRVGV